jgi:hypothetical protein
MRTFWALSFPLDGYEIVPRLGLGAFLLNPFNSLSASHRATEVYRGSQNKQVNNVGRNKSVLLALFICGLWRRCHKLRLYSVEHSTTLNIELRRIWQKVVMAENLLQCTRGLRHKPSSPARIVGSWVRIPFEAYISVCVYSVFVLFCV